MKKLFIVMALVLATTVILFGCGKTENNTSTGSNITLQTINKTGTLQGKIMDATTGAPISMSASGDRIVLIQGDADRGPTKLVTDPNDPLVGEYSFSGIPVQAASGGTQFKVVVIKAGYQRFEADLVVPVTFAVSTFTIDNVINMIGNIYLFPVGATPGDVTVTVTDARDGVPQPNVTVLLEQDVFNNSETAIIGDRLRPSGGLYTSMTTTTDANGVATFSGANLVLGGSYIAKALAITNPEGEQLATTTDQAGSFIIGTDIETRFISMTQTTNVLFATSATNQLPGTVHPDGVLSITFNKAIALTTTGFVASGLASDGTPTTFLVQATLSADFLTMTLTPNSVITGTTAAPGSGVRYIPVTSAVDPTPNPNATPFIIRDTQANSGFTFGFTGGAAGFSGTVATTNPLKNNTTNAPVNNFIQQIAF